MRIVDADELRECFEPADFDNDDGFENCWNAVRITDAAPTIDAIPMEWLRHRLTMAQKNGSAHPEQAIQYVLWLWEQQKDGEQEAR